MQGYAQIELAGATDVFPERARALTADYGGRAYATLEEMLADFESAKEYSLANWATEALGRIERDRGTSFIEAPVDLDAGHVAPDEETVRTKPVR